MSQDLLVSGASPGLWEDETWFELLDYIESGQVIPIIGPDLVRVETDKGEVLYERFLADQLLAHLESAHPGLRSSLPAEPTLNDVVSFVQRVKGRRAHLYSFINQIGLKADFSPPISLQQLAGIVPFNLFVTTNPDRYMEKALDLVRFGGQQTTRTVAYSPGSHDDLACGKKDLRVPTVFHLLGAMKGQPGTYAICDEDLLEFVHRLLQESDGQRPVRLFDELKESNLLILGVNFSDWLARFFLYAAKRGPLSSPRNILEIVADTRSRCDPSLVLFLQHFSSRTRVFQEGGAVEFVEQLARRWSERAAGGSSPPYAAQTSTPAAAVFISYAREDLGAVHNLKAGLEAGGVTVWVDLEALEPGADWARETREKIKTCSCFVAVVSANTEKRDEGFYYEEWLQATERARRFYAGRKFLIPVLIDENIKPTRVPDLFGNANWTKLSNGQVTPQFVQTIRSIVAPP